MIITRDHIPEPLLFVAKCKNPGFHHLELLATLKGKNMNLTVKHYSETHRLIHLKWSNEVWATILIFLLFVCLFLLYVLVLQNFF